MRIKRILIISVLFFIGISFSNTYIFNKKTVVKETIEVEEVIEKVTKVKKVKRVPANIEISAPSPVNSNSSSMDKKK
ncbi:MAG: hypothetical protein WDA09_07765 [Bacteriovoracaceae bacterium]